MYTTREFASISVFSLATLLGLAARPASAQTLSDKELGALLDKESMTKADHLKLADHYSAEATQLAKDAERHTGLAVHYRLSAPQKSSPESRDCLSGHAQALRALGPVIT